MLASVGEVRRQRELRRGKAACRARDEVSEIDCIYDALEINHPSRHLPHMCIVSLTLELVQHSC